MPTKPVFGGKGWGADSRVAPVEGAARGPESHYLVELGLIDALAVEQEDAFRAGLLFARNEDTATPESIHVVAAAVEHARTAADGEVISSGCPGTACWTCPPTATTSASRPTPDAAPRARAARCVTE